MSDLEIKGIRNKLNISQSELAKILGISIRTIQNWEAGGKIPETKHEILRNMLSSDNNSIIPSNDVIVEGNKSQDYPERILFLENENKLLRENNELLRFKIAVLEKELASSQEIKRSAS